MRDVARFKLDANWVSFNLETGKREEVNNVVMGKV